MSVLFVKGGGMRKDPDEEVLLIIVYMFNFTQQDIEIRYVHFSNNILLLN